jgi:hypothetical protein
MLSRPPLHALGWEYKIVRKDLLVYVVYYGPFQVLVGAGGACLTRFGARRAVIRNATKYRLPIEWWEDGVLLAKNDAGKIVEKDMDDLT